MRCSQADCNSDATMSYIWPGKANRDGGCWKHIAKAIQIVSAFGMEIGDVKSEVDGLTIHDCKEVLRNQYKVNI